MYENFGQLLLSDNLQEIYDRTSIDFKNAMSYHKFQQYVKLFNHKVKKYHLHFQNKLLGMEQYIWLDNKKKKVVVVSYDDQHVIQQLLFKPYVIHKQSDEIWTKNKYQMPINEPWLVFWGGPNEFVNYHYPYELQRYAYDLVIARQNYTYNQSPKINENYYAFNKEVVAPLDGQVVKVVTHLYDNAPGEMDETSPGGNYIVIAHENNEYSMLAHLKQHSIVVKAGEFVKQGQVLGRCGNSGISTEPHLHFQLMTHANIRAGKSLRIRFEGGYEPRQGDVVYGKQHTRQLHPKTFFQKINEKKPHFLNFK